MKKSGLALCLMLLGLAPAQSQSNFSMPPPAGVTVVGVQVVAACGAGALSTALPAFIVVDQTGALCTSSSGGGGGAVTIADGADVTQGAIADAAAAAGGEGTLSAKLRLMTTQLGTLNTTLGTPMQATGGTVGLVAGTAIVGKFGIDQTTPGTTNLVALGANQTVNLAQVAGTNTVTGGTAGSQGVGGTTATDVAITDNPVNNGGQAVSAENTLVTAGRKVQGVYDRAGRAIVSPYANLENAVSGVISSAMTGTTSTSLVASPGAGLRNYITQITCSNAHATVGTDIIVQDGSGGTTIYLLPAAAVYGGAVLTFPFPLRQPTAATALFVANVTTGASTKCAASGFKSAL